MRKLMLLLATIVLGTVVVAFPTAPLRADNCGGNGGNGGNGGSGGILRIPIFQASGDCTTVPEPSSAVLLAVGIGALGLVFFLRELKASKAADSQANRP